MNRQRLVDKYKEEVRVGVPGFAVFVGFFPAFGSCRTREAP